MSSDTMQWLATIKQTGLALYVSPGRGVGVKGKKLVVEGSLRDGLAGEWEGNKLFLYASLSDF